MFSLQLGRLWHTVTKDFVSSTDTVERKLDIAGSFSQQHLYPWVTLQLWNCLTSFWESRPGRIQAGLNCKKKCLPGWYVHGTSENPNSFLNTFFIWYHSEVDIIWENIWGFISGAYEKMLDEKTEIEDLMRLSLSVSETYRMNSGSLILLQLILFIMVTVRWCQ